MRKKWPKRWEVENADGTTSLTHEIRFVCTDRATHPSREIGVLTRHGDDDDGVLAPTDKVSAWSNNPSTGRAKMREPLSHKGKGIIFDDVTWRFRCPTCRREVQWRLGRTIATLDTLIEAGVNHVDISALPANLQ